MELVPGAKYRVLHCPVLYEDPRTGESRLLMEVVTTKRDYTAVRAAVEFLLSQVACLAPPRPRIDHGLTSSLVRIDFSFTDYDLAALNAWSLGLNGCK